MATAAFKASGPLLVRMSTLPAHSFRDGWRESLEDAPDERIAEYVRELAGDPVLREAVEIASESLADSLDRIEKGTLPSRKRLLRIAASLTKYALRISGRPTPFGTFAAVGTAEIGPEPLVRVGTGHRKAVRPDAGWLSAVSMEGIAACRPLSGFRVALNDLCFVRGDRLHAPWVPAREAGATAFEHLSLPLTPAVRLICKATKSPVAVDELIEDVLRSLGPDAPSAGTIEHVVERMITGTLLVTSVVPATATVAGLERLPGPESGARELAMSEIAKFAETRVGEGTSRLRSAVSAMRALHERPGTLLQVDLMADISVRIPADVLAGLEDFATAMWRLSAPSTAAGEFDAYRESFQTTYGINSPVPLERLLDPSSPLGLPEHYGKDPEGAGHTRSARDVLVSEVLADSLLNGMREVILDDELIRRFERSAADGEGTKTVQRSHSAPPSLELCVKILAPDVQALKDGRFRLALSGYTGSRTPGSAAGRFADMLGIADALRRLNAEAADDGPVHAQLCFAPSSSAARNVSQVPPLLDHQLPVGVFAERDRPDVLNWRDLAVVATIGGLRLVSTKDGREVIAVSPSAVNTENAAPPLVRFLVDISESGKAPWQPWNWGGLAQMPALPRVRYGKVIVSPARWKPAAELLRDELPWPAWERALGEWREKFRVPRHVQAAVRDEAFPLDLEHPVHRRLLRQQLNRRDVLIQEDLATDPSAYGWFAGHAHEVVVPLVRDTRVTRPAPVLISSQPLPTPHSPGGEWLYAKVYGPVDCQDSVLAQYLPSLVNQVAGDVDRWFYIRYQDPEDHIRLRLHGDPGRLHGRVLPELRDLLEELRRKRLVRNYVLDSYTPESHRYGGTEVMPYAEELFSLDSYSSIYQLRRRAGRADGLPDEVLAAANYGILLDSLGAWNWAEWVARVYPHDGEKRAVYRRHEQLAHKLIVPGQSLTRFTAHTGLNVLRDLWTGKEAPSRYGRSILRDPFDERMTIALMGMLHMQHNRLLGINPEGEQRSFAVLRGVARTVVGRPADA
ncbi:lantibiotic dehydratase [Streptomyces abikoensis]|uniref:lantibiotic dehydratase n=1 Tax=Streptomyces abikoensis TaxID=97398 RepID=UPI0033CF0B46